MKINGESIYYGSQADSNHLVQGVTKSWSISVPAAKVSSEKTFYEVLEVSHLASIQGTVIIRNFSQNDNILPDFTSISVDFRMDNSNTSATILDNRLGVTLYIKYRIVNYTLVFSMSATKHVLNAKVDISGTVLVKDMSYVGGSLPRLDLTANSNIFNEAVVMNNKLQIKDRMVLKHKYFISGSSDSYTCPVTGLYVIKPATSDTISIVYKAGNSKYTSSSQCYIWLLAELET